MIYRLRPSNRRYRCLGFALLMVLGADCAAQAQEADKDTAAVASRIVQFERKSSHAINNLAYLADVIGPRLTGSPSLETANRWTAKKMKEYDLENVHLEPYTIPQGWKRGRTEAKLKSPFQHNIAAAQVAWTKSFHGIIRGKVVIFAPKNDKEMATFKGRLRGAVVLLSSKPPMPAPDGWNSWTEPKPPSPIPAFASEKPEVKSSPPTPKPESKPIPGFEKRKAEFLKREGAKAIILETDKPYSFLFMFGSWMDEDGPKVDLPTFIFSTDDLSLLYRLIQRHHIQPVVELRGEGRFIQGPITVYNTVGEIKGTTKPAETVILGGHLDSWDLGTGAVDNGTGAMATLEAARLLKAAKVRPARTIRFVLFSGEEEGDSGSRDYIKKHRGELKGISAVFIHDSGTGRIRGISLQDRAECREPMEQAFNVMKDVGLLTESPGIHPGKDSGSDHDTFDDAGIPAFTFDQEPAEYGLAHHSEADVFDRVRPDDLRQGACVMAILGYFTAQREEPFPRSKPKPAASK